MTKTEIKNWERIKDLMEEKGTTDNYFYKLAIARLSGRKDPWDPLKYE